MEETRGLSADEWIAVGASPNRFVLAFRLADSQVKLRGPYRVIYDARKPIEAARLDDAGKPVSPMIAHRRAMRKMVSVLLNDLWAISKGIEPRGLSEANGLAQITDARAPLPHD